MYKFFINRPIVAMVIAILTVIIGAVSMMNLPVAQFPNIVPPEISIQTTFVGVGVFWSLALTGFCVLTAALTATPTRRRPRDRRWPGRGLPLS